MRTWQRGTVYEEIFEGSTPESSMVRNAHHRLSLPEVAQAAGLSKSRLGHRFPEEMQMPVHSYARRIRMQRAFRLLEDGRMNIAEIADLLGFPSIWGDRRLQP